MSLAVNLRAILTLRPVALMAAWRDARYRVTRRLIQRYGDLELRQLRSLLRAYDRGSGASELLIFGDSSMYWTSPRDRDRRYLAQLIRDATDPRLRYQVLMGPGYNGRIVMAYLSALEASRSRPRVVVVPASVQMAQSIWLANPGFAWEMVSDSLRTAIESDGSLPRRLNRPGLDDEAAYDRLLAPSFSGAQWTVGEVRLATSAVARTPAQKEARLRHILDYHYAERLEPTSPGIRLVREMGATLQRMGLPSVAYIQPVNTEFAARYVGPDVRSHIERHAGLVEAAYLDGVGGLGAIVNDISGSPTTEFYDPIHLNTEGRLRLAGRIGAEIRRLLGQGS